MKSTWFKEKYHYEFAKYLQEASYTQNSYSLFTDWLEVVAISLRQAGRVMVSSEQCQIDENRYLSTIKKYKHPENLSKALGVMVLALEDRPHDFLGDVFHALSLNDKNWRGQVFTPYCISEMMAIMTLGGITNNNEYHMFNRLTIDEPACGGGAMIIAAAVQLRKLNFSNRQFYFNATDVDHKCVLMTYIQCTLLDIPCIVNHGNTLSLELWRRYPTLALLREPIFVGANKKKPSPTVTRDGIQVGFKY